MAKTTIPLWSYGGVVIATSNDYGQTTQPEWSYGRSVLDNQMPTEVDIYGETFSYGTSDNYTSEAKTFEPTFSYGTSRLVHLFERVAGRVRSRLRGTHTWVTKTMMRKGRF
jgi:hypothetical protein